MIKNCHTLRLRPKKRKFRHWLIGFVLGDGSLFISCRKSLGFEVSQHKLNLFLLHSIRRHLGFGTVKKRLTENAPGKSAMLPSLRCLIYKVLQCYMKFLRPGS